MQQILAAIAFLTVALPLSADEKDDAIKKLNGTYEITSYVLGGKLDDSKKEHKPTVVINDGVLTIKEDNKRETRARFTIDPTKKPAHLDLRPEMGPKEPIEGLYELKDVEKGTELTITFVHDGGPRPKDFKGEGKDVVVMKLLRKKEK